jgi:hypothetical protein
MNEGSGRETLIFQTHDRHFLCSTRSKRDQILRAFLCQQIAIEQDRKKLTLLVNELNTLLDRKEQKLLLRT